MEISRVLIIAPAFEQRISKMAYQLKQLGVFCEVLAEEALVAEEFKDYIKGIPFSIIPISDRLKRTPFGKKRNRYLKEKIKSSIPVEGNLIIIARDVNYGCIIGKIIKKINSEKVYLVTDIADNYDLLYASYRNYIKRVLLKLGFNYLTKTAFFCSDALIIVTPVNYSRIRKVYPKITDKPIFVLRNLPLEYKFLNNNNKLENSFVYVGKIDEISRDPLYILEQLTKLENYTLHFYSSQKESTIEKIRRMAESYGISNRVIFHERVPYDQLAKEISKYVYGLVPHKRSPITDYTVPNKIYDYKSSGIVTIMSDCPSLIYENDEFGFGVVYNKAKDNFIKKVEEAKNYKLNFSIDMPTWEDEFNKFIENIRNE